MTVAPIPMMRGGQLLPFMETLRDQKIDPSRLLRACHLPVTIDFNDSAVILPTNRVWEFIEASAIRLRDKNTGWDVAMRRGIYGAGHFGYRLENQGSLQDAMQLYASGLPLHASVSRAAVLDQGDSLWFRRGTLPPKGTSYFQVEQYALGTMLHIVRRYAGRLWQPRRIKIVSAPRAPSTYRIYDSCGDLETGADFAAIEVPRGLLSAAPLELENALAAPGVKATPFPEAFHLCLTAILCSYAQDYPLTLPLASRVIDLHPRTLNRRLEAVGLSFRDIRDKVLLGRAKNELRDPSKPISALAAELGYSNPSAFTRAFIRLTGSSPRAYRKLQ